MTNPVTEKEARQKWCPFVRIKDSGAPTGPASVNRSTVRQALCNCLASDCMAWRWRLSPDDCHEIERETGAEHEPDGYCRLIGTVKDFD